MTSPDPATVRDFEVWRVAYLSGKAERDVVGRVSRAYCPSCANGTKVIEAWQHRAFGPVAESAERINPAATVRRLLGVELPGQPGPNMRRSVLSAGLPTSQRQALGDEVFVACRFGHPLMLDLAEVREAVLAQRGKFKVAAIPDHLR